MKSMKVMLRRFLVMTALLFWQGGFLFYSSVVVPIGQEMLGTTQAFVTRRVTQSLNLAGAVALVVLLPDALARGAGSRLRKRLRLAAWVGMAVALGTLVWMHPHLDAFLDHELHIVEDHKGFRPWHRVYLWVSTIQWALGVVYLWLTIGAWRDDDRAAE
jgi:hypothetical protein